MAIEFPRCVLCRVTIQPETNVVFRVDGRVQHVECPQVVCPVCLSDVLPGTPIRRDGEALLHSNCWLRRYRTRASAAAPSANGRRDLIRARLAGGALPSTSPTGVRTGTSRGAVCAACNAGIAIGQPEYEVHFANVVSFRLHQACYAIWQEERDMTPRQVSGGSAPSAWTLVFDLRVARRAAREPTLIHDMLMAAAEARRDAAATRERSRAVRAVTAALKARSGARLG